MSNTSLSTILWLASLLVTHCKRKVRFSFLIFLQLHVLRFYFFMKRVTQTIYWWHTKVSHDVTYCMMVSLSSRLLYMCLCVMQKNFIAQHGLPSLLLAWNLLLIKSTRRYAGIFFRHVTPKHGIRIEGHIKALYFTFTLLSIHLIRTVH